MYEYTKIEKNLSILLSFYLFLKTKKLCHTLIYIDETVGKKYTYIFPERGSDEWTGKNAKPDAFKIVRNTMYQGVTEASVQIADTTIQAAVVCGLANTRKLLEAIERGEMHYDFVEVMECPGGCVGGGGQPICDGEELASVRGEELYFLDENAKLRFSHENKDVQTLYRLFLERPLSHKAHMLLHTDHQAWDMPRKE